MDKLEHVNFNMRRYNSLIIKNGLAFRRGKILLINNLYSS